jgi:hypothetical protein
MLGLGKIWNDSKLLNINVELFNGSQYFCNFLTLKKFCVSPTLYYRLGQIWKKLIIQWPPLIVITDNVIIRLVLSLLQSPGRMGQFIQKKSAYCNQK